MQRRWNDSKGWDKVMTGGREGGRGGIGVEGDCGCVLMGGDPVRALHSEADGVSYFEKWFGGGIELSAGVFNLGHYTLL